MNILLISGEASVATRDVWNGYASAFRSRSVHVVPYPLFSMLSILSPDAVCHDIVGKALDVRNDFDLVLFVDGLFFRDDREWVPLTLSARGLVTAVLATEDPYETICDDVYDIRFTNERTCQTSKLIYLPTAANISATLPVPPEQDIDICFVGTVFAERWPLLQQLADYCEVNKIRFELRGHIIRPPDRFENYTFAHVIPATISEAERFQLYSRAKIVLNIFREHPTAESANPRVYEVTALGSSALLTTPRQEVYEVFGTSVYTFSNFDELIWQIDQAIGRPAERNKRITEAQKISTNSHSYENRVDCLLEAVSARLKTSNELFPIEENICWIFGAPRTGSTWLLEMLECLEGLKVWSDPRFGWITTLLNQYPEELYRKESFFSIEHGAVWSARIRQLFFDVARSRWPAAHASDVLLVKEATASEFAPFAANFFPMSKYLLLVRDPFDVLDSHIDMQQPGGWNESFWQSDQINWTNERKIEFLAKTISLSFKNSIAGFSECNEGRRLRLRYEDLLHDPVGCVSLCAKFLGIEVNRNIIEAVAEERQFDASLSDRGRLSFRRFGRSGQWRKSPNFTRTVHRIAEVELGQIRNELGYD